ncbi:MAG: SHOCT domain-containing protein [Roseiarcus sp.]
MQNLTPEGLHIVTEIATRHGVSLDAALTLLGALRDGNGTQAQFSHPDLGGMGQWSQGGMIMVGDMFNQGLKYRVDGLCNELAGLLRSQPVGAFQSQSQSGGGGASLFVAGSSGQWWPAELGSPASVGAQNDLRYAYFPGPRRLAIQQGAQVRVYDTGEHRISGFSQAQSGDQTLTFTSQFGLVRVAELGLVSPRPDRPPTAAKPVAAPPEAPPEAPSAAVEAPPPPSAVAPRAQIAGDAIFTAIERLADLRQKNILSEDEFAAKKRELLSRL